MELQGAAAELRWAPRGMTGAPVSFTIVKKCPSNPPTLLFSMNNPELYDVSVLFSFFSWKSG